MRTLTILAGIALLAACGGSNTSSTAPSATATSVSVTLASPIVAVNKTTNATGTATLTNGQTQSVTSGWRSDVTTVATVTDGGVVTGVATGRANIYVVSGGRQGQAQVRVVPNYAGQWRGTYVVRSCTAGGAVQAANLCGGQAAVGSVLPINMTLAQSGDVVTGQFNLGLATYQPTSGTIGEDGRLPLGSGLVSGDVVSLAAWQFSSTTDGRIVGPGVVGVRVNNQAGEGTFVGELIEMTRTAGGLTTRQSVPIPGLSGLIDALAGR